MLRQISTGPLDPWNPGAPAETHRAGGLEAELGQPLWGEPEVCRQAGFLIGHVEGRLAVGCCCLRGGTGEGTARERRAHAL